MCERHRSRPLRPSCAVILTCHFIHHADRNRVLSLDELHAETLGCVPCDMAMEQPRTRVVQLERDSQVAVSRQSGDIATRRVDEVEVCGSETEGADRLSDDEEIVAVHVDWVVETDSSLVLDHVHRPCGCGTVEGNDVVWSWEDGYIVEDLDDGRGVPVKHESRGVDGPCEMVGKCK